MRSAGARAEPPHPPSRLQCLKYLTDQAADIKRIEKLNNLFVTYMCGKDPHEDVDMEADSSAKADRPVSADDSASNSKKRRAKR